MMQEPTAETGFYSNTKEMENMWPDDESKISDDLNKEDPAGVIGHDRKKFISIPMVNKGKETNARNNGMKRLIKNRIFENVVRNNGESPKALTGKKIEKDLLPWSTDFDEELWSNWDELPE